MRADGARPVGVAGGTQPAPSPAKPVADPGDFETALTPNIEKLQGAWEPLELVTSGTPLQASYLPFGSRTHAGVETKVVFGGQTMLHAKMRFNDAATPVEVDYLNLAGKGKGSISRGLFRWDGEEAVFCIGAPGSERPSDFTCNPGSGRRLAAGSGKVESGNRRHPRVNYDGSYETCSRFFSPRRTCLLRPRPFRRRTPQ